jgi:hypothetical protein
MAGMKLGKSLAKLNTLLITSPVWPWLVTGNLLFVLGIYCICTFSFSNKPLPNPPWMDALFVGMLLVASLCVGIGMVKWIVSAIKEQAANQK